MRGAVLLLLVALVLSACDPDGSLDAEEFMEAMEEMEQMASEAEAEENSNDSNDDSDYDEGYGPPNTDSPNRPPIPEGGVPDRDNRRNEELGMTTEGFTYSPDDASYEDLVDYYEAEFGDEGEDHSSEGAGRQRNFEDGGRHVTVREAGVENRVVVIYPD